MFRRPRPWRPEPLCSTKIANFAPILCINKTANIKTNRTLSQCRFFLFRETAETNCASRVDAGDSSRTRNSAFSVSIATLVTNKTCIETSSSNESSHVIGPKPKNWAFFSFSVSLYPTSLKYRRRERTRSRSEK
jgi:hypothetical protein